MAELRWEWWTYNHLGAWRRPNGSTTYPLQIVVDHNTWMRGRGYELTGSIEEMVLTSKAHQYKWVLVTGKER